MRNKCLPKKRIVHAKQKFKNETCNKCMLYMPSSGEVFVAAGYLFWTVFMQARGNSCSFVWELVCSAKADKIYCHIMAGGTPLAPCKALHEHSIPIKECEEVSAGATS